MGFYLVLKTFNLKYFVFAVYFIDPVSPCMYNLYSVHTGKVVSLNNEITSQLFQPVDAHLNLTTLHFSISPTYSIRYKMSRGSLYLRPPVRAVSAFASVHWTGCLKCHMMTVVLQEVESLRTARRSLGLWIPEILIKIDWGLNIPTLKGEPRGSHFKTRVACYRGISWCCSADTTIVVYLSCDK